eukprot:9256861-Pyramimonas_sp.AAC.1
MESVSIEPSLSSSCSKMVAMLFVYVARLHGGAFSVETVSFVIVVFVVVICDLVSIPSRGTIPPTISFVCRSVRR